MGKNKDNTTTQTEKFDEMMVGANELLTLKKEGHRLPPGAKAAVNTFGKVSDKEREYAFIASLKLHQFRNQITSVHAIADSIDWRKMIYFKL